MKHFGLQSRLFEEADPEKGVPGAFDAAAFQTSLMAEVTKAITAANTATTKAFKAEMAKHLKVADPPVDPPVDPPIDPNKPRDPLLAGLERSNKAMEARMKVMEEERTAEREATKKINAQAEEKERHSAIRAALGDFAFAPDSTGNAANAREDAFRALREDVKRGEDGELYGGDFVPLKDYIKTVMATKTHLLAPKQVDSSGARPNGMAGGRQVQVEDIKSGMDPKVRDAAWEAVRIAAANAAKGL